MRRKHLDELISSLIAIHNPGEMEAFLRGLLTPGELEEIPKRLEIIKLLKKGVPQHEIAQKLHVGVATVTRGSQELKRGQFQKTSWWNSLSQVGG